MLRIACRIAKDLGYFSIDADQQKDPTSSSSMQKISSCHIDAEKNQKRFVFWHLLRTDSFFRLDFGKPNLIAKGSWNVNFPDLTITGIDDKSFHLIQIHFLVTMRVSLLSMKFLDWINSQSILDPESHDTMVENYIKEIQSIIYNWDLVRDIIQM